MKNLILLSIILVTVFFNCGDEIEKQEFDSRSHCEIARDYINKCIGAKVPKLESCDEGVAIEIVNTPCSELSKVIFDK